MVKYLYLLASSILAQQITKDSGVKQCQELIRLNPS